MVFWFLGISGGTDTSLKFNPNHTISQVLKPLLRFKIYSRYRQLDSLAISWRYLRIYNSWESCSIQQILNQRMVV